MSPSGIYVGLPLVDLQTIKTSLIARITNGDLTSISGASKSSSRNFAMSPQDALFEVNYALGLLNNTGPARTTYFDVRRRTGYYPA